MAQSAVLGANDGLVSNFCLIIAIAGAGLAAHTILFSGFAGLAAGACSMAMGEWLSVTNAREAEEIEQTPEAERHELALGLFRSARWRHALVNKKNCGQP